jgi:hypothetical protein
MAISQTFDDVLKDPRLLPDESAIAVHFRGGHGGILFGFDSQSRNLASGHHILPHAGALAGYDVAAVVAEARRRAAILVRLLPSHWMPSGQPERSSLPPWPWR